MKLLLFVFIVSLMFSQKALSKKEQIERAVLALPKNLRANATVLGYRKNGDFGRIRKGSNHMICIADDPKRKGFSVAAYHKNLEPFMKRGRELRTEGKQRNEVFSIREKEADSGQLKMPSKGSTLHIYFSKSEEFDSKTNQIKDAHYRYVVYIPNETSETTGLPTSPTVPGAPWIMHPGTHRAHIMISPVKVN